MNRPMSQMRALSKLVVIGLVLFVAPAAWGTLVSIKPVRIHLAQNKRSELVELRNTGKEPARYQLGAHGWQETSAGEMKLQKTGDLVVFPTLLELKAGESRRVRVASALPAGRMERSYRLVVEELPGAQKAGQVRVITHLNVPVFVRPSAPAAPRPTLTVTLRHRRLTAIVANGGNSYFKSVSVRVVARSEAGKVLLEETLPGWYVLAGGRRVYNLDVQGACPDIAEIDAELVTDHGRRRTLTKVEPQVACGN